MRRTFLAVIPLTAAIALAMVAASLTRAPAATLQAPESASETTGDVPDRSPRRRSHVRRSDRRAVQGNESQPIEESELDFVRRSEAQRQAAVESDEDAAETALPLEGVLLLTDLTNDLHVRIEGQTRRTRRHERPPGPITIELMDRAEVIGRASVVITAGQTRELGLAEFEIPDRCMARSESERLRPEHHTRGCCRTATSCDYGGRWLARHQSESGMWSDTAFADACRGTKCTGTSEHVADVRATALALLTFLGSGETHNSGEFKWTVKRALRALKTAQTEDGWFSTDRTTHAVATLAMCEAYGLTGSRLFKGSAQSSFARIRSLPAAADVETAALEGFVLHSAIAAEIIAPDSRFVSERRDHLRDFGLPGPAMARETSLLLAARVLIAASMNEEGLPEGLTASVEAMTTNLSRTMEQGLVRSIDPLTIFCTTIVAFQAGGPTWKSWNNALGTHVVKAQSHTGTWEPHANDASGSPRGRLTTTALMLLTAEIYYRYGRVFGASAR